MLPVVGPRRCSDVIRSRVYVKRDFRFASEGPVRHVYLLQVLPEGQMLPKGSAPDVYLNPVGNIGGVSATVNDVRDAIAIEQLRSELLGRSRVEVMIHDKMLDLTERNVDWFLCGLLVDATGCQLRGTLQLSLLSFGVWNAASFASVSANVAVICGWHEARRKDLSRVEPPVF